MEEGKPAPLQRVELYTPPAPVPVVKPEDPKLRIELSRFDEGWPIIKTYVEELAAASAGEYGVYQVAHSLMYGISNLYMGFLNDAAKTFVGFLIVRFEPQHVHIWQAYILPPYRHTNVFEMGAAFIEAEVKKVGGKTMTFSANREWAGIIEKIGFKQGYTVYRKEIA